MKLFKFVGFGSKFGWVNTLEMITNGKIWLSATQGLNDPFEGRAMNKDIEKSYDTWNFRVLSLTTNLNNNLMWSHYAYSHNGIVIEFETDKCSFLTNIKKVNYVNKLPSGDLSAEDLLTYKQKGWEYEDEYRVLVKKSLADFGFHGAHYEFNSDAIQKVYIGKNVEGHVAHTIFTMCKKRQVPCFLYHDISENFEIKFKKITAENVFDNLYRRDLLLEVASGKRNLSVK